MPTPTPETKPLQSEHAEAVSLIDSLIAKMTAAKTTGVAAPAIVEAVASQHPEAPAPVVAQEAQREVSTAPTIVAAPEPHVRIDPTGNEDHPLHQEPSSASLAPTPIVEPNLLPNYAMPVADSTAAQKALDAEYPGSKASNPAVEALLPPAPAITPMNIPSFSESTPAAMLPRTTAEVAETKQEFSTPVLELPFEDDVHTLAQECALLQTDIASLSEQCEELAETQAPIEEIISAERALQQARRRLLEVSEQLALFERTRALQLRWSQLNKIILTMSEALLENKSGAKDFSALRQQLMILEANLDFHHQKIQHLQAGKRPEAILN